MLATLAATNSTGQKSTLVIGLFQAVIRGPPLRFCLLSERPALWVPERKGGLLGLHTIMEAGLTSAFTGCWVPETLNLAGLGVNLTPARSLRSTQPLSISALGVSHSFQSHSYLLCSHATWTSAFTRCTATTRNTVYSTPLQANKLQQLEVVHFGLSHLREQPGACQDDLSRAQADGNQNQARPVYTAKIPRVVSTE